MSTNIKSAVNLSASDQTGASKNQALYSLLFNDLVKAFPTTFGVTNGVVAKGFHYQFPDPTEISEANWVNQVNDPNSIIQQFQLGDRAPLLKEGRYTSGSNSPSVFTSFTDWVAAVEPDNFKTDPNYLKAQTETLSAANALTNIMTNAQPSWDTWFASNPNSLIKNITQWLTQSIPPFEAQPYATQYQNANAKYISASENLARVTENLNLTLSKLKAAVSNVDYQSTYKYTPPGGTETSITAGTTSIGDATGNPITDWQSWSQGGNLNRNPFSADIKSGVTPVNVLESVTVTEKVTESWFFGLFSHSYEETVTFFEEVTKYEHFNISMDFGSVQPYSVSRAPWYDSQVLNTYKDNSYDSTTDFFNTQNGPLFLIPSTIFLAWNPKTVLTLSEDLYNKYAKQLESNAGIVLAGIKIGVGMKPVKGTSPISGAVTVTFGDQSTTESLTTVPSIVGYVMTQTDSTATPNGN